MKIKQIFVAVFLIMLSAISTFGQSKKNRIWGEIPRSLQPQLINRLKLFTESQRNRNWEKLRTLLTDSWISIRKAKLTEEQIDKMMAFIKERPIIKFTPKVTLIDTSHYSKPLNQRGWWIGGCAEYVKDGNIVRSRALVIANLKAGRWVFTNFRTSEQDEGFSCDEIKEPAPKQQ